MSGLLGSAVSDDLTPLGSRGAHLAIGPCGIRLAGGARRWAKSGSRPATKLMVLAVVMLSW